MCVCVSVSNSSHLWVDVIPALVLEVLILRLAELRDIEERRVLRARSARSEKHGNGGIFPEEMMKHCVFRWNIAILDGVEIVLRWIYDCWLCHIHIDDGHTGENINMYTSSMTVEECFIINMGKYSQIMSIIPDSRLLLICYLFVVYGRVNTIVTVPADMDIDGWMDRWING